MNSILLEMLSRMDYNISKEVQEAGCFSNDVKEILSFIKKSEGGDIYAIKRVFKCGSRVAKMYKGILKSSDILKVKRVVGV